MPLTVLPAMAFNEPAAASMIVQSALMSSPAAEPTRAASRAEDDRAIRSANPVPVATEPDGSGCRS